MEELLARARALVAAYDAELSKLLPSDAVIFDAHVHVGRDIDGFVAPYDELVAFLRRYGVSRAFAFCMDEPDREPGFRAPNDRTLAASTSGTSRSRRRVAASTPARAASSSIPARRASS